MRYIPKFQDGTKHPLYPQRTPKIEEPNVLANTAYDFGTRTLNALGTFGGSVIGDIIHDVGGKKAAQAVEKYTAGMIPYTKPEQFAANRQRGNWNSRINQAANSASMVIGGEILAGGIGYGIRKGAPYVQNISRNVMNKVDNSIPPVIDKFIKPRVKLDFSTNTGDYTGEFLNNKAVIGDGMESVVYHAPGAKNVDKVRHIMSPTKDIRGIQQANRSIYKLGGPDTRISGYFRHPETKTLQPILKQGHIEGVHPSLEEVKQFAINRKLKPLNDHTNPTYDFNGITISDLHPENFLKDKAGKLYPIDLYAGKKRPLWVNTEEAQMSKQLNNKKLEVIDMLQHQAHQDGVNFTKNWFYKEGVIRPEVESKILNIVGNKNISGNYKRLNAPGNPVGANESFLGSPEEILQNTRIHPHIQEYVMNNRKQIAGVQFPSLNTTITLRTPFTKPDQIKNVATHELGHSAQNLAGWGKETTVWDKAVSNYASPNMETEIGQKFAKAMVKPKAGKAVWEASPNELHSDLMIARSNLFDKFIKKGMDSEQAMQLLQNPTDKIANQLISAGDLTRFTRFWTPKRDLRELIKILPAATGVGYSAKQINQ